MSTDPGGIQVEGGNNTAATKLPENDELIVAPSAPFNPETDTTQETIEIQVRGDGGKKQHPLQGWWWKILIVLFVLFLMVLFIVWIGPSYIWGDKNANQNTSNSAQESDTFPPTYNPTLHPTLLPTFYPTLFPTISPNTTSPTSSPNAPTLIPTMQPSMCTVDEGTYLDYNELCNIIDTELDICYDVDNGQQYQYKMDPQGCSSGITCTEESFCFNSTHYSDGWTVYESVYYGNSVGDTVTCTVTRSCQDSTCET
eukprot:UN09947